jgi:tetratricopeptide (TPR) repeat protein
MKRTLRGTTLLLALLAGCVTTSGPSGVSNRIKQADQKFPPSNSEFSDDFERGFVQNINSHHQAGGMAANSGAMDQARAEWATEAQALADFSDKFLGSEWVVSFRFNAAKYFFYAGQPARAVEQADKLLLSPEASDGSKALAAKLAHAAVTSVAQTKAQAGQLEQLRLLSPEQRRSAPLNPRSPPGEWKQLVEYADTYVKLADQDPDNKKAPKDRLLAGTVAQVAVSAAQVKYGFDNMEDSRGRFTQIFDTWPAEIDAGAVKIYLWTFTMLKDQAGYDAAVPRLKARVGEATAKATDAKAKENLAKVLELLGQFDLEVAINLGIRLLDAGQFAQSGAAFEAFVAANPTNQNVPLALFNGAIAYEKANLLDKAAAMREQLVTTFPDSKEAEAALPTLAALRSRQGKKDEAVKLYRAFIEKYPDSPNRCGATYNMGAALDESGKKLDAAAAYLAYGADARCGKDDSNAAAKILYRSAVMFENGHRMADARKAYQACAEVAGVTDTVAKSNQAEARKRAKR